MTLTNLLIACINDHKGQEIAHYPINDQLLLIQDVIVATASSATRLNSIANHISQHPQVTDCRVEGEGSTEWILLDLGNTIIHLMTAEKRTYYSLDRLYQSTLTLNQSKNQDESINH